MNQDIPRNILRNCHFISLMEDKIENLVRFACELISEGHVMDDETFVDSDWIIE